VATAEEERERERQRERERDIFLRQIPVHSHLVSYCRVNEMDSAVNLKGHKSLQNTKVWTCHQTHAAQYVNYCSDNLGSYAECLLYCYNTIYASQRFVHVWLSLCFLW
jgi:hypothetical protein